MLFKLARSAIGKSFVGWIMEHWYGVLPLERLYETGRLVAFRHPQPVYSTHILIVPKKAIPDLTSLSARGEDFVSGFMNDLLGCVSWLVEENQLGTQGYRLIVNGGDFQDIPQLHFHLVSGVVIHSCTD